MKDSTQPADMERLAEQIENWSKQLGFDQVGFADVNIEDHGERLNQWLSAGYHGDMSYMQNHDSKRYRPSELVESTLRVISLRMNYYPESNPCEPSSDNRDCAPKNKRAILAPAAQTLEDQSQAFISRYSLGRDYHKLVKSRLKALANKITQNMPDHKYRLFVDSAPVLERALATKAGLGWQGKNTMLIHPQAGSYFFLSEIFTNLPLPVTTSSIANHCGSCRACLDVCPTKAFVKPFVLDARRCISYLTIELKGSIPVELRPLMGNRIFGCDDCQLYCPWNKFTRLSCEQDFMPRNQLNSSKLITLFNWSEEQFLKLTEGSAIRRAGYESWLRNIAVALGNGPATPEVIEALRNKTKHPSAVVKEHVIWALNQHQKNAGDKTVVRQWTP
ncbi:MAG: tRNA epoxyqueuosine(34) reductase QueG [Gammaproteobacteria bacterium]|nr:MAG: tRNA epoxyqueuosine(34) reductase QueG [Gammaproteobacteria bacterium]